MVLGSEIKNELERILGCHQILNQQDAQEYYGMNTISHKVLIAGAFIVKTKEQICEILKIANLHKIALYPISTGKNWGYGGATPVKDNCYILDLSQMNNIIDFDSNSGVITVEPGVTQVILREFLNKHNYNFMVPTTGAGPNCSLLGNALERGFGAAAIADHFGAVNAMEIILASGEILNKSLSELGCHNINQVYKWGSGPYLDGIFTQSNLGIVSSVSIKLARKVDSLIFILPLTTKEFLENISKLVDLKECLGGILGTLAIANANSVLAITSTFPLNESNQPVISDETLNVLREQNKIDEWVLIGCLYGNKHILHAAKKTVNCMGLKTKRKIVFLSSMIIKIVAKLSQKIPGLRKINVVNKICKLSDTQDLFLGYPNEGMLKLPYWMSDATLNNKQNKNPDKDGCGLIWYTPLVETNKDKIAELIERSYSVCKKYNILPIMRFVMLNSGCFDCTIPILYDSGDNNSINQANQCYNELIHLNLLYGNFPYRMPASKMDFLNTTQSIYWNTVKKIKQVLDPNNIISPGRYNL